MCRDIIADGPKRPQRWGGEGAEQLHRDVEHWADIKRKCREPVAQTLPGQEMDCYKGTHQVFGGAYGQIHMKNLLNSTFHRWCQRREGYGRRAIKGERGANSFIIVAVVIGNLDQSLGAHETYKAVPAGLDEIDYTIEGWRGAVDEIPAIIAPEACQRRPQRHRQ